jgi:FixJ family two-component response regulator
MGDLAVANQGCVFLYDMDTLTKNTVASIAERLGYQLHSVPDTAVPAHCQRPGCPRCWIVSDSAIAQAEAARGQAIEDLATFPFAGRSLSPALQVSTIVLCEQPDVAKVVRYMRAGALTVLPMPVTEACLAHWIAEALALGRQRIAVDQRCEQIRYAYQQLSPRKREVLQHMIDGRASKWSAFELDVSRRTIELDRAEILTVFGVSNAIELARLMIETKCLPLNFSFHATAENSMMPV